MDTISIKKDLQQAEIDVVELVALAESTLDELKRLPECDENILGNLSQQYLGKLKGIQEKLKGRADILDKANLQQSFQDNYLKEKEEELSRSEQALNSKQKETKI